MHTDRGEKTLGRETGIFISTLLIFQARLDISAPLANLLRVIHSGKYSVQPFQVFLSSELFYISDF